MLTQLRSIIRPLLATLLGQGAEVAQEKADRKCADIASDLWSRQSIEDLLFLAMVLVDSYGSYPVKSVASVTSTETTSLSQVQSMICNCGPEIAACMSDEKCRAALDCLNSCKGNDQVCSYRCITSHETETFEKFAYCILQKNNCMNNRATVPVYPSPVALTHFRGQPLDATTAEDIFIGHLRYHFPNPLVSDKYDTNNSNNDVKNGLHPWSWKVVCGQNPAYDHFACQHQLYYRDKEKPSQLWYDPVFQVTTLDGEKVWRRRHYTVRHAKIPGHFSLSGMSVCLYMSDCMSQLVIY